MQYRRHVVLIDEIFDHGQVVTEDLGEEEDVVDDKTWPCALKRIKKNDRNANQDNAPDQDRTDKPELIAKCTLDIFLQFTLQISRSDPSVQLVFRATK